MCRFLFLIQIDIYNDVYFTSLHPTYNFSKLAFVKVETFVSSCRGTIIDKEWQKEYIFASYTQFFFMFVRFICKFWVCSPFFQSHEEHGFKISTALTLWSYNFLNSTPTHSLFVKQKDNCWNPMLINSLSYMIKALFKTYTVRLISEISYWIKII